ncbi:50S ribosomal protein L2 [Candidatus Gottesmanbacteria bacterium RIFCSPHIGHO2_02_FULL_39_11]|uniref:Large ribosomal subunit protein uL2 n=1 Tax=Candidatus Gottesmanbacteria bacterium RIFCSPHIGHO2_02_FULL_39_11 TaxID=1798382 RepID=A0A1F5ZWV3_9BACT|nr:MAG: 50S ribosomal protein L2 [Candidatus Gottesmanbacteria bacterium RIFCSPHIGHO2_02_FULL_39_11]
MRNITKSIPEKKLTEILIRRAGRNNTGKVTAGSRGGGFKRFYRMIDFKRDKYDVSGKIVALEYDPNRNVEIALVLYEDGEKRYILSPLGIKVGDTIISSQKLIEAKLGNAMKLQYVPIGTPIHNIELHINKGGQIVRGAGTLATVLATDSGFVQVKLPSGEIRQIPQDCMATVGQLANTEWKTTPIGSAGRARRMGIRPHVRGTAQDPRSHPHGGGEGRSGEGMHPKTPWGKPARGLKTRKKGKYSDRFIIKRRGK